MEIFKYLLLLSKKTANIFNYLTNNNISKRILFFLVGLMSTIWLLIRVIPKPSRITYPCMKAAAPFASSFITYIIGISAFTFIVKKIKQRLVQSKIMIASLLTIVGFAIGLLIVIQTDNPSKASNAKLLENPNDPMGEGKGIFPGRVVWVYNPDATNENCKNQSNDYWSMDKNTNQTVVNEMLSDALQALTGENTDSAAWDALFRYFNKNHDKGDVGYHANEKIAIKINFNGYWNGPQNVNTSPQICYAVLDQLTRVVGVEQQDIGIGDPNIPFTGETWDKCHTAFPNVIYWGTGFGQTQVESSTTEAFFTSDGIVQNLLPQEYLDAAYLINIPVFKKHHRSGISLCCKNHFGSVTPFTGSAFHLHYSLPCPDATGEAVNGDYGVYRCFVDIMGHKDLGAKTVLFLIDGIWGSVNWGHPPVKWRMSPFNNDWLSSLFLSQDPVAIESVGFDFLYYEFDENHPTEGGTPDEDKGPFPQFSATDDYLHQSADPTNWPNNIEYDPENDGTILTSMGVHEHWNNATDKKYSKDLGTGEGIELYRIGPTDSPENIEDNVINSKFKFINYPNPFKEFIEISYTLPAPSNVEINIYNIQGQLIKSLINKNKPAGQYEVIWDGTNTTGLRVETGYYISRLIIKTKNGTFEKSQKILLAK